MGQLSLPIENHETLALFYLEVEEELLRPPQALYVGQLQHHFQGLVGKPGTSSI